MNMKRYSMLVLAVAGLIFSASKTHAQAAPPKYAPNVPAKITTPDSVETRIGLIFLNPLLGFAVGASAGAVSGALTDVGIDDKFMKELAATMNPASSVLFVLVRRATPDKVLQELHGTGGKVLKTSLSHDDEAKLQAALSATK